MQKKLIKKLTCNTKSHSNLDNSFNIILPYHENQKKKKKKNISNRINIHTNLK